MKVVNEFSNEVKHIENTWIEMSDGCRLAARVWYPEGAENKPVPGILEYLPYRKRDGTRERDNTVHPYFAGHGYACVRVDMRGSGDSEGVLTDEYLEQEQKDGLEILKWMADQDWCNGDIGMIGISWGGFNGLQIAALEPTELKAIVTCCSTDDRYADDVHYMGGCLLGDNLSWASTMFAYNSCPPDPEIVGDKWRDLWMKRLEGSGLWLNNWLRHQHRDGYWKHGSICEDFSKVKIPVLAVSGWADGYTNAVFRLMKNLDGPCKGLVGPWSHKYPQEGEPGPAIDFLDECIKWWDRWLKDEDNGVMDEDNPQLIAYMQDSVPPYTQYEYRPGKWVTEDKWPSPDIKYTDYKLGWHTLEKVDKDVPVHSIPIESPLTVGLFAGKWCSYQAGPDLPHDQRQEDGGAIIFETEPLAEKKEILGSPVAEIKLSVNKPCGMIAARLSDVAPDGKATRITYGILNLTHRDSHESPQPLEPGQKYKVRVELNDIAQVFPKGHKMRLSLSSSYWPLAWPSPEPAMLNIFTGESEFSVPVRPSKPDDGKQLFGKPKIAEPLEKKIIEGEKHNWRVIRNLASDESVLEVIKDMGTYLIKEIGTQITERTYEWYTNQSADFHSAEGKTFAIRGFKRGGWSVRTETTTVLTCDKHNFYIHAQLDAFEGEYRIKSLDFDRTIPRKLV